MIGLSAVIPKYYQVIIKISVSVTYTVQVSSRDQNYLHLVLVELRIYVQYRAESWFTNSTGLCTCLDTGIECQTKEVKKVGAFYFNIFRVYLSN